MDACQRVKELYQYVARLQLLVRYDEKGNFLRQERILEDILRILVMDGRAENKLRFVTKYYDYLRPPSPEMYIWKEDEQERKIINREREFVEYKIEFLLDIL